MLVLFPKQSQKCFLFQNTSQNLHPSYKMDLDFWYCFGRESPTGKLNCTRLLYMFVAILEGERRLIAE